MNNIQESIFQAIDVITEKRISEIKFDKTIDCIVTSDANSDKGEYEVKYQDIVFTAYSSNNTVKYKIDDNVYVLIPQGDFSVKKNIIGKRDGTGEEYLDIVQIIDKIQTVGGNYVNEPEGFSFAFSTSGNNELKELSFKNEEFIKDYKNKTNLLIGANISTNLYNEQGDYGLKLDITYKSGVRHSYTMSMNSMTGNPYKLEGGYQYKVFPLLLDEIETVNGMYLYAKGFSTPVTNSISFKNIEVSYAKPKDVEGLDQFEAEILTPDGTMFKNGIVNEQDSLRLDMTLKKVGKVFKPSAVYKWFFMDSTVTTEDVNEGWDIDGGLGWRLIKEGEYSEDMIKFEENGKILRVYPSFVPNIETFKCVAIFGGEKIEYPDGSTQTFGVLKQEDIVSIVDQTDAVNIIIESSRGDVFKEGDGVIDTELTCKVVFGAEVMDPSKFLYSWSKIDDNGDITPIAINQNSEKLTVNIKNDILNIENYICEVFLK